MLTRYKKNTNNKLKYQKNKNYHQYWFNGKKFENIGVKYHIKEANFYLKDRCDGFVFKNIYTYVGSYTGPQTRSMTKFIKRRNYMLRKKLKYLELLKCRRTRSMTNYLKYYHYKNFGYYDKSL